MTKEREYWTFRLIWWYRSQRLPSISLCWKKVCDQAGGGFLMGEYFSRHSYGKLSVSGLGNQYFSHNIFEQEGYTGISVACNHQSSPMSILEKFLGVPFFENLGNLARKRLATMDDATSHIYGLWLMSGISRRHPEIENDFCFWFMSNVWGERLSALASYSSIQGIEFDASVVFEDLLMALGENNLSILDDKSMMSLEHLRLLEKVWTGENMRVSELIAILELYSRIIKGERSN
ncbi:MAG: hypothetical protein PUP92_32190 [Rhizonema sp. PD38]|nr:hypothetical protein [Rhizonema sp. PD38]